MDEPRASIVGAVHICTAIGAMAAGLCVVLMKKGGPSHRAAGKTYAVLMLLLNGTALSIYRLNGHFGPFHVSSLVSLATLFCGLVPVLSRRPRRAWLDLHAHFMAWSYVGLLAAFASETAVRVFQYDIVFGPAIATAAVMLVGAVLIAARLPKAVRTLRSSP